MNDINMARSEVALQDNKIMNPLVFWINMAFFGFFVFWMCLLYIYLENGKYEIFQVNQAAASVGTLLISFSMILSSLSYFFDRFDRLMIYRKHLGIIGFAYIVAHIIFVILLMPWMYKLDDWLGKRVVPFMFGLTATIIFSIMTGISNKYAITTMGGTIWRSFLRYGGYSALILSLLHIWFATGKYWQPGKTWPLSILVFSFGGLTLAMRLLMKTKMTLVRS